MWEDEQPANAAARTASMTEPRARQTWAAPSKPAGRSVSAETDRAARAGRRPGAVLLARRRARLAASTPEAARAAGAKTERTVAAAVARPVSAPGGGRE